MKSLTQVFRGSHEFRSCGTQALVGRLSVRYPGRVGSKAVRVGALLFKLTRVTKIYQDENVCQASGSSSALSGHALLAWPPEGQEPLRTPGAAT